MPILTYAPFFKCVGDDFCVSSVDLMGQGRSDPVDLSQYTLLNMTELVLFILEYMGWSAARFHIVAHGFGCAIGA